MTLIVALEAVLSLFRPGSAATKRLNQYEKMNTLSFRAVEFFVERVILLLIPFFILFYRM